MENIAPSLPLFESAKRKALRTLLVRRRLDDGPWVKASRTFASEELPNRDAVRARFGGGYYEILGRGDGQKIVGRTRFVVDGPPRPLDEDEDVFERHAEAFASPSEAPAVRPFATPAGEREAIVFALLDEGHDVVEITRRTGIEARTVRAIFAEWITPLAARDLVEARRRELGASQRAALEAETEKGWTR